MTDVVYTAIYGGYDPLRPLPESVRREGVRYLCYTDDPRLRADGWEVVYLPVPDVPAWFAAKAIKILGQALPEETTRSVWLDASIVIRRDPVALFDRFPQDLAFFRHFRRCLYHEAARCRERKRDYPNIIEEAANRYRELGHPPRWGLWMGGFIFRRHSAEITRFNETWWEEINKGSRRDQISLPYVLRTLKIPFATLSDKLRGQYFQVRPHHSQRSRRRAK